MAPSARAAVGTSTTAKIRRCTDLRDFPPKRLDFVAAVEAGRSFGVFDTETTINTALPLPTSPGGGWVGNTRISSANMPVNLVAHYPLDGDVTDVGDHIDGGFVVGATPTSDRFGAPDSAYAFDGEGDRIVMDRGSHLAVDTVSIAAWIRMDDDTAPRPIEEWWGVVSYLGKGYVLAIQGDGAAIGGLRGSAGDCTFAGSDTVFDLRDRTPTVDTRPGSIRPRPRRWRPRSRCRCP